MTRRAFPIILVAGFLALGLVVGRSLRAATAASGPAVAVAATPVDASGRTVSVSGEGRVGVKPDLAYVTFGVESTSANLAAAQDDNTTRMTAVIAKIKASGVADADVQTTGYNVAPQYDKDRLTGYRVSNNVRVTARAIEKIGPLIDGAVAAGANRVTGIVFDVANKDDAIRRARELAVADARAKAEQYAKLTGVTLGGPITISESGGTPAIRNAAPAAAGAASTPIETGESTITIGVQITYELR